MRFFQDFAWKVGLACGKRAESQSASIVNLRGGLFDAKRPWSAEATGGTTRASAFGRVHGDHKGARSVRSSLPLRTPGPLRGIFCPDPLNTFEEEHPVSGQGFSQTTCSQGRTCCSGHSVKGLNSRLIVLILMLETLSHVNRSILLEILLYSRCD